MEEKFPSHIKNCLALGKKTQRSFMRETVAGIIRSIENYGVFVELTPNLAGLAELRDGVRVNHQASVYIKAIIQKNENKVNYR